MKSKFIWAIALVWMLASPAYAGDCQADIADFDAELAAVTGLSEGEIKEAEYMRDQAAQACAAGDEDEAEAMLQSAYSAIGG